MKRLLVALVVATSLVLLASPCCGRALQADADKVLANKDFVESVSPKPDDTLSEFLERTGKFDMFLRAVRHFKYDRALDGKENKPSCVPQAPRVCFLWYCPPAPPCIPSVDEEALSKEDGPFTVLAPTDDAMTAMIDKWGKDLTLEKVLKDESLSGKLKDVIQYHIVRGAVKTPNMVDNAEAWNTAESPDSLPEKRFASFKTLRAGNTTSGSEIVVFKDENSGKIRFHEDCVDQAPPSAEHGCALQAEWGKCKEDWMQGYCALSCQRCTCDTSSEACEKEIIVPDIELVEDDDALEVTVHVLSAVLEPPERFEIPTPPPPPPPPPPVMPPVYVWNPYTHRQEIMAEWNPATESYETPEDPTSGVDPGNSVQYTYNYVWDEESGQYQYVMDTIQG